MASQKVITCPSCKTTFNVNEETFTHLLSHLKEDEIERNVKKRLDLAKVEKQNEINFAKEQLKNEMQKIITAGEKEILSLKADIKSLTNSNNELKKNQQESIKLAKITAKNELRDEITKRDLQVQSLNSKLTLANNENLLKLQNLSDKHKITINDLTSEIERLKTLKSKLSTKMIGESLEQHCETQFNLMRADGLKNATFVKDNNLKNGTKADYLLKVFSDDQIEVASAIFGMKNETHSDSKKKKNSDFFEKLDKDRKDKNCKYAILVSALEPQNDFYNRGIVEISDYPYMYAVRPSCFNAIISLIRDFGMDTLNEKRELNIIKSQSIDLTNFEDNLENFKNAFGINFDRASKNFNQAIEQITKIIEQLEKTKTFLMKVQDNFRIANGKAQGITIKRLTNGNPFMERIFKMIREEKNEKE